MKTKSGGGSAATGGFDFQESTAAWLGVELISGGLGLERFGFIGRMGFDRFFISGLISLIFGNVPWDGAPYEYGRDYIIQY